MSCYENLVMKTQMNLFQTHYSTYALAAFCKVEQKQNRFPCEKQIPTVRRVQEAECIFIAGEHHPGLSAAGGGDFYYSDTPFQSILENLQISMIQRCF